jgi:exosortase/archaeosortase family protein
MQATKSAQRTIDQAPDPVNAQPAEGFSSWLRICTALLAVNGICCLCVWMTSLGADPVRQVLAGVLALASAALAWRKDASRANSSRKGSSRENSSQETISREDISQRSSHVQTQPATLVLIACCLLICLTGNLHTARLYLLTNTSLLLAFAWKFFGWQRCKALFPATFLSMFALPDLPEEFRAYLFVPLQHICTITAGELAKLFVPLTYSGHIFTLDGQEMNVAPSCAGLGMWACFLFAFAIWQGFKKYKPSAYVAAFFADPILVLTLNTVRIALTAIVAHYHSLRLALEIHAKMELVLVPLGLFILWKVGAHFADEN